MAEARTVHRERLTPAAIRRVVDALAKHPSVECVVLFGSQAAGTPDEWSDLDLLVVMDTDLSGWERARPLRDLIEQQPCAMDLIVRTPQEVRYWNGTVNHIVTEALETGTVVYAAPNRSSYGPMTRRSKERAQEFLKKADNDLVTARAVLGMDDGPTDTPAFHAQQATEKALKALLTLYEIKAPRTHSLAELMELMPEALPALERFEADYEEMSKYGVYVRYPAEMPDPTRAEARHVLEVAEQTVAAVRTQVAGAPEDEAEE